MIAYMMAVGVSTAAMYSVFGDIQANSSLTLDNLNQGTGYMVSLLHTLIPYMMRSGLTWFFPVPSARLGLLVLATIRVAIRQTTHIFDQRPGDHGNYDMGTLHHEQCAVDRQQDPPGLLRSAHRESLRDHHY